MFTNTKCILFFHKSFIKLLLKQANNLKYLSNPKCTMFFFCNLNPELHHLHLFIHDSIKLLETFNVSVLWLFPLLFIINISYKVFNVWYSSFKHQNSHLISSIMMTNWFSLASIWWINTKTIYVLIHKSILTDKIMLAYILLNWGNSDNLWQY